jgi:cellulase/cellobiase CelA1
MIYSFSNRVFLFFDCSFSFFFFINDEAFGSDGDNTFTFNDNDVSAGLNSCDDDDASAELNSCNDEDASVGLDSCDDNDASAGFNGCDNKGASACDFK